MGGSLHASVAHLTRAAAGAASAKWDGDRAQPGPPASSRARMRTRAPPRTHASTHARTHFSRPRAMTAGGQGTHTHTHTGKNMARALSPTFPQKRLLFGLVLCGTQNQSVAGARMSASLSPASVPALPCLALSLTSPAPWLARRRECRNRLAAACGLYTRFLCEASESGGSPAIRACLSPRLPKHGTPLRPRRRTRTHRRRSALSASLSPPTLGLRFGSWKQGAQRRPNFLRGNAGAPRGHLGGPRNAVDRTGLSLGEGNLKSFAAAGHRCNAFWRASEGALMHIAAAGRDGTAAPGDRAHADTLRRHGVQRTPPAKIASPATAAAAIFPHGLRTFCPVRGRCARQRPGPRASVSPRESVGGRRPAGSRPPSRTVSQPRP